MTLDNTSGRLRCALLGRSGRMGQSLERLIRDRFSQQISIVDMDGRSPDCSQVDLVIDFSRPAAILETLRKTGARPVWIIGTTGFSAEEWDCFIKESSHRTVLYAANFSVGIWALRMALRKVSNGLLRFGFSPVLVDEHHLHKKDAPSGTAKALLAEIDPERRNLVQVHSIRAGEIIGEHEVRFYHGNESVVFTHSAKNRDLFALGAIEAGIWLAMTQEVNPQRKGLLSFDHFMEESLASI